VVNVCVEYAITIAEGKWCGVRMVLEAVSGIE